MKEKMSPSYQMKLIKEVAEAIQSQYEFVNDIHYYINKWHESDDGWNNNWENFQIIVNTNGDFELIPTLQSMDGDILLKIAIDLGLETPDFIPSIPTFRNEIKSNYKTASATFEKAFRQIEEHPDIAIGLVNSAMESIIKEIFKDERIVTKPRNGKTHYELASELLKEFQLFPESKMPIEIKTIGSSLLAISQNIEKLRSEKTNVHGKTSEDYIIDDALYTYFIVNSAATVALFLDAFYRKKLPKTKFASESDDDLPF